MKYSSDYRAGIERAIEIMIDLDKGKWFASAIREQGLPNDSFVRRFTVIWNDHNSDGLGDYNVEEIWLNESRLPSTNGVVSIAMAKKGYTDDEIKEALAKDYGLVGIIRGTVDWLL